MITRKFLASCAMVVPVALLSTACSRSDDATRERAREMAPVEKKAEIAYVRFIDAHTGNAALYFGDNLAFGGGGQRITDYKELPAERHQFALRPAGQPAGDALATNSEGLSAGKHYTVIAFNDTENKASLRVVNDDESAPDPGKAKIRLIHASPAMEALNLYAKGRKDAIADQSRFTTGSNWQEVDPVSGALELRSSDKKTGAIRIPDVTLEAGKLYTFVVRGGDGAKQPFSVTPIIDIPRS